MPPGHNEVKENAKWPCVLYLKNTIAPASGDRMKCRSRKAAKEREAKLGRILMPSRLCVRYCCHI